MGSINKSHNETDGGILLFQGELILLYCDSVQCEIGGKESVKGRVYLTTHRLVMIVTPYRQDMAIKSLCAPFCAITKCSIEQPVFKANYMAATVRDETDSSKSFSFKLRFSKGGAIEFAMAMNRAVAAVGLNFNPSMPPPPAYTPAQGAQYYQAPPTVYAPGYDSSLRMPVEHFTDQPPIGFIYTSTAPPPYPGVGAAGAPGNQQQPPPYGQPQSSTGYPGSTHPTGQQYPQPGQSGYPQQQPGYPAQQLPGNPVQQQPSYPVQPGYPAQQQPGYPAQLHPSYPEQQYPSQPAQQPPAAHGQSAGYPDLSQGSQPNQPSQNSAWPTAPSFNPNWQEDKKSA